MFGFFEKTCILLVGYLIRSAKQMLFQLPMYQQNKGERVCFISLFIYIYLFVSSVLMYVCILFTCIYLQIHDIFQTVRSQAHYFGHIFLEKRTFCLLTFLKQMPFLTISNKNIFFKTQGNRLGMIVAPNKHLEQTGPGISTYKCANNHKYMYKNTNNQQCELKRTQVLLNPWLFANIGIFKSFFRYQLHLTRRN